MTSKHSDSVRRVVLALGLTAAISACSHASSAPAEAKPDTPKIHVDTVVVAERSVPKILNLTGELSSNERTDLAANANGRVVKTFVERGDHVAKGAVLAQLDTRSAALSSAEAQANAESADEQLKNAQTDCQRYVTLLAKGAITKQEYDKQTTNCQTQSASAEAARARAASAEQTLTDSSVRAPFAGVIAERFVHVGDYVHSDTRVVTLLVDDPLRLELTVPEANVGSVHPGIVVSFVTSAFPTRAFAATVKYMGGEIREATRDLVVEAVTANADHVLLPGMFVKAQLSLGEVQTLPMVPVKSLVHKDSADSDSVFVVVDGKLVERIVQTGSNVDDLVAIADGVVKGERVVVSPPPNAADGMQTE